MNVLTSGSPQNPKDLAVISTLSKVEEFIQAPTPKNSEYDGLLVQHATSATDLTMGNKQIKAILSLELEIKTVSLLRRARINNNEQAFRIAWRLACEMRIRPDIPPS